MSEDVETLSEEQLDHLAQYFNEEVMSAQNYKISWNKVQRLATG